MASTYYKPCAWLDLCRELIEQYFERGDYKTCFEGYYEIAKCGYPLAECQVGYFYMEGLGVEKDEKEAFYWTEKAAIHGDRDAQFNLAVFYENGTSVGKNMDKARHWYKKSALQAHNLAMEKCIEYGILELRPRTIENVEIYFHRSQHEDIKKMLPSVNNTLQDAFNAFAESNRSCATSYGRTIYFDGQYIGDIWCYCIDKNNTPNAMLSFCIFEMGLWGCGICTGAIRAFLDHLNENLNLNVFGAFTYADNIGSIRALEKNGFKEMETFMEDGRWSKYFEWSVQ